jgi:hypothetical protein
MGDHIAAAPGIEAAKRLLFTLCSDPASVRDIPHALALNFCGVVIDSYLFGSAHDLVGKRFPDVRDVEQFRSAVIGHIMPALDRVAQQLAMDATASTLKYPRQMMRSTRRRTGDLLHEPLT